MKPNNIMKITSLANVYASRPSTGTDQHMRNLDRRHSTGISPNGKIVIIIPAMRTH